MQLSLSLALKSISSANYLLRKYGGAAAAYSLQRLDTSTENVVRVRRSSDNAEADFTAEEVAGGALAAYCGVGNGFVVTLYDQSGNGRDATQATAARQPQIVADGVVVTDSNGNAAISNPTANSGFRLVYPLAVRNTNYDIFCTYQAAASQADGTLLGDESSSTAFIGAIANGSANTTLSGFVTGNVYRKNGTDQSPSTRDDLHTAYHDGAINLVGLRGAFDDNAAWDGADLVMFNYWTGPAASAACKYNEIIIYQADQSANRSAIEANIAARYGIILA